MITLKDNVAYTVGRDPECDITVSDELVAPLHFRLKSVRGTIHIRDENTESGTLVNDERTEQKALSPGDKIQIGATVFSLVAGARKNGFTGKSIGGYSILDRLGRGGMGTVYRALQESLNREVALKLLSPRLIQDPQFIERFATEARAAAALSHPNVIQVFDVGSEGKLHYYSMEYARNGTVEEMINRGDPIPVERALAIVRDAAQGLFFAETQNLVHQDIKPQNLMVDQFGVTKIADMGLARSLSNSEKVEDEIVGTPHFISPERILRKEADIRSDIYSLGCTFYRILTGKTPFHGDTAREILQKQLKEEPAPIRELRSDVPDQVCQVIKRMMQKDPNERYPGVAALLADLETLEQKKGSIGKLAAVGLVVAAAAIAGGFFLFGGKDSDEEKSPDTDAPVASGTPNKEKIEKLQNRHEKEMAELKAQNMLLEISDEIPRDERIKLFDELVAGFPGTNAADTAAKEAAALRRQIEEEARILAEKLEAIEKIRSSSHKAVTALLAEKRFFEALHHASRVGTAEQMETLPEVEAIRVERTGTVAQAVLAFTTGKVGQGNTMIDALDFAAARKLLERALPHLERPAGFEGEAEYRGLQGHADTISETLAKLEARQKQHRLTEFDRDLAAVTAWDDVAKEQSEISRLIFTPPPPLPELATLEYRRYLDSIIEARRGGDALLKRFTQVLADNRLKRMEITHPSRGDSCTIVNLANEGKSLRLDFSGTTRLTVELSEFASGAAFIDLIEGRFEMAGRDLLTLARSALIVEAARSAAGLAPLMKACEMYEQTGTWSEPLRQIAAESTLPKTDFLQEVNRLLDKAASLDAGLKSECEALRNAAYREATGMELFAGALSAFTKKDQGALFRDALAKLEEFAIDYSDTFFCRYTAALTGGSLREGGHLVEFSE